MEERGNHAFYCTS